MPQHIIFEGAELSGKTWLMSQLYNYLEPKYNQSRVVLDGCHWFNCDVGIFGTENGRPVIKSYLQIFKTLNDRNLIVEKFFISDLVYNQIHRGVKLNYTMIENELITLGFKIVLCTFPEDEKLLEKRIKDRLNLYPHYQAILQTPAWYIRQQQQYVVAIKKTGLPYLVIEARELPDEKLSQQILKWLGENK